MSVDVSAPASMPRPLREPPRRDVLRWPSRLAERRRGRTGVPHGLRPAAARQWQRRTVRAKVSARGPPGDARSGGAGPGRAELARRPPARSAKTTGRAGRGRSRPAKRSERPERQRGAGRRRGRGDDRLGRLPPGAGLIDEGAASRTPHGPGRRYAGSVLWRRRVGGRKASKHPSELFGGPGLDFGPVVIDIGLSLAPAGSWSATALDEGHEELDRGSEVFIATNRIPRHGTSFR